MGKKAKKEEVKFPFEPNECVKAAFRQDGQLRRAITLMTEAIAKVASDVLDPWEILKREYPDLLKEQRRLKYNQITQTIDLDEWHRRGSKL